MFTSASCRLMANVDDICSNLLLIVLHVTVTCNVYLLRLSHLNVPKIGVLSCSVTSYLRNSVSRLSTGDSPPLSLQVSSALWWSWSNACPTLFRGFTWCLDMTLALSVCLTTTHDVSRCPHISHIHVLGDKNHRRMNKTINLVFNLPISISQICRRLCQRPLPLCSTNLFSLLRFTLVSISDTSTRRWRK